VIEPTQADAAPVEPPASVAAEPTPTPSPFAGLRTNPGSVLASAFDLLARTNADVRSGSFYVGLIFLGTVGPVAVLLWGLAVVSEGRSLRQVLQGVSGAAGEPFLLAGLLAFGGLIVAYVESRAVATALLGARLAGREFDLRDAVRRSRAIFWPLLVGIAIINIPVAIAQELVDGWLAGILDGESEVTSITAAIVVAIIASPFAYVLSGIVLGNVGPVESARRSTRLFSARRLSAVVVSVFALAAQFLTLFGTSAGLDLVARVFDSLRLGPGSGAAGIAAVTVVILAVVFAIGSLLFTVAAIAAAPQVVMFLALTHATPGLDATTVPQSSERFRWLTLPMRGAIALGMVVAVLGLVSLNQ
jgi:hypothetical protein